MEPTVPFRTLMVGSLLTAIVFMVMAMPLFYLAGLYFDRMKVYEVYKLYKICVIIIAIGVMTWVSLT